MQQKIIVFKIILTNLYFIAIFKNNFPAHFSCQTQATTNSIKYYNDFPTSQYVDFKLPNMHRDMQISLLW